MAESNCSSIWDDKIQPGWCTVGNVFMLTIKKTRDCGVKRNENDRKRASRLCERSAGTKVSLARNTDAAPNYRSISVSTENVIFRGTSKPHINAWLALRPSIQPSVHCLQASSKFISRVVKKKKAVSTTTCTH